MMEVLSRKDTDFTPSMAGTEGRAPALMKILSAVSSRRPPSFCRTSSDFGPVKLASPKIKSSIRRLLDASLAAVAKAVHDIALALSDTFHIDANVAGVNAVIGASARQVGDATAGDHRLGGSASLIDTGPADMFPLNQSSANAGFSQCGAKRRAGLA